MEEKCIKEMLKGVHMGIIGIEHVVDKIQNEALRKVVVKQKREYETILAKIHNKYPEIDDKKPGIMVKSMIEMKTIFSNDNDIVKMLMKGCNNAVISMTECIHELEHIDSSLQGLADDIEDVSKNYENQLKKYL